MSNSIINKGSNDVKDLISSYEHFHEMWVRQTKTLKIHKKFKKILIIALGRRM